MAVFFYDYLLVPYFIVTITSWIFEKTMFHWHGGCSLA